MRPASCFEIITTPSKDLLAAPAASRTNLPMQLTAEQKQQVSTWIAEGMKLSDIQNRLATDFDIRLTYMDARLLVDDLKLTPLDPPSEQKPAEPAPTATPASAPDAPAPAVPSPLSPEAPAAGGKVALTVDTLARPGTMVSGNVTFSDGIIAAWYLDQTGRLGVVPENQGYRPPEGDVEIFQRALDQELAKLGY